MTPVPWLPYALAAPVGAHAFRVWMLYIHMDSMLHRTGEPLCLSSAWISEQIGMSLRGVRLARHELHGVGMIRMETEDEYHRRLCGTRPGDSRTRRIWLAPPWEWGSDGE